MIKPNDVTRRTFGNWEFIWPTKDTQMAAVAEHVSDIDVVLEHVKGRKVCIQAGGACGVWPLYLSSYFETVYTFEPLTINFRCMSVNCFEQDNIVMFNAALGCSGLRVHMEWPGGKEDNFGAQHVAYGGVIPTMTIDSLDTECDLIYLDAEGSEPNIIAGALNTMASRPVVVFEDKGLAVNFEHDINWLKKTLVGYGYREVGKVHRDAIWVAQ